MKSSLKRTISLILAVVMITTTYNFNSFAVSFDNIIKNELDKTELKNKNSNIKTKYYEELLSEKKQLLMNDDKIVNNDENNNDTTVANTTANDDIDKTVENYINENNKNKQTANENNITNTNNNDNGNQVNDVDENENITSNEDNTINNKTNDATNKSTNKDENKNDVQVDVVEDDIIDDDIDNVVSDAIAVNDTSNLNNNDGEYKSDIEQLEISISTDSDMDIYSESQVFGIDGEPKVGDTVMFGVYEQDNNLNNGKEPIEWTILEINENERYVILFANQVLDKMKYTNIAEENNYKDGYKNSTIRNFLINDFYNIAFTERDKRYIKARKDVSEDGSEDTVWLLSEREFSNYHNGNNNLAVLESQTGAYFRVSDYACSKGGSYSQEYYLRDYDTSHYGWYYRNDGSKYWRMAPCKFIDRNKVGRIWNTTKKGVRPGVKVDLGLITNSNDIIWDLGDKATWIEGYVASTSYTSEMSNPLPESDKVFKEGYEFKYWSIDGIETDTIDEYQIGDIVVKANWEELKYNINYFDSPGATEPLKIATRSYFTSYTLDEKPSWSRPYNFRYWADRDTHEIVESNEVIQKTDKNINVYAVWDTVSNSEMNNNITWELDGGKWDSNYKKPLIYDIGQNNILPTNKNIKKDNKYLSGWKLNNEIITTIPSTTKGDIILKAEWIDSNYKINYYESKDSNTIKKTTSRAYDQKVVLDKTASWAPQFRTVGYWIDKETNEKITEVPVNTFKDINVYPVWVKDQKYINSIKVGDTIKFGHYPQSSADYNVVEPVEWEVKWIFEEYNCKYAVLSSKKILDYATAQWDYRGFLNKLTREDFAWYDASSFSDYSTGGFFTTSYPGRAVKPYISQNLHISSCTQYLYDYPKLTAVKATNYVKQKAKERNPLNSLIFSSYNDEIPYWAPTLYESIWNTPNCWVYDKKESNPTEYNTSEESARLAKMRKSTSYQGVRPMVMLNLDMVDGGATKSKITWDRDGGNWKDAKYTPIEEYEEGKITSLPTEKDIIKTGYKLDGWYINTDRTKVYKEIPATQTGPITLTAKWTKTITQYKIKWKLDGGAFKDEYKHYETDKHNDTEDFILPTEDMLTAPYGKVFKEWLVEGVATTSIAKEIKKDVSVVAKWTRSSGGFESYYIGKYKLKTDAESDEVLEWLILDKKDDKLLLMTKDVIDNVSYDTNGNTEFKNSSIKKWLNKDFYENAFDDKQKRNILNNKNNGKVFLLTEDDYNEYFVTNLQSIAEATNYATNVKNGNETLELKGNLSPYWLMTHSNASKVPYVSADGSLNKDGAVATAKTIGVRPCVWVEEKKMEEVKVYTLGELIREMRNDLIDSLLDWLFGRK